LIHQAHRGGEGEDAGRKIVQEEDGKGQNARGQEERTGTK